MKIIVGLGNPGEEYRGTRHNAGYLFLDSLVQSDYVSKNNPIAKFKENKKFQAQLVELRAGGEKVVLVKPTTFMNLSGNAVASLLSYYQLNPEKSLFVISDDKDLPVGQARIRMEGSSGGQKGIQSIIDNLGNEKFARIRIGIANSQIANNSNIDTANFVLGRFSKREEEIINKVIDQTIIYIKPYIFDEVGQLVSHTINVV